MVFRLTMVYGPSRSRQKEPFLNELCILKPLAPVKWIVLGDFSLIYQARDKSNGNINRAEMAHFRNTLHNCELHELHLQNRKVHME